MGSDASRKLAEYDDKMREEYGPLICGIDETGRGAFAGPIMGAACVLPPNTVIDGLNDSKKLSESSRERLVEEIKNVALAWSIVSYSAEEIDKKGINYCNSHAMIDSAKETLKKLGKPINLYIVDQSPSFPKLMTHIMMPKADGISLSVAAASVLAKTERDRLMKELSEKYPMYCFDTSMGYANEAHIKAVVNFGMIKGLHRKSFKITGVNKPRQTSMEELFG